MCENLTAFIFIQDFITFCQEMNKLHNLYVLFMDTLHVFSVLTLMSDILKEKYSFTWNSFYNFMYEQSTKPFIYLCIYQPLYYSCVVMLSKLNTFFSASMSGIPISLHIKDQNKRFLDCGLFIYESGSIEIKLQFRNLSPYKDQKNVYKLKFCKSFVIRTKQ